MVLRAATAVAMPGTRVDRRRWLEHRNLTMRATRVLVVTALAALALALGSAVGRLDQGARDLPSVTPRTQPASPRWPAAAEDARQPASAAARRL
jgi:hypothetical protein